MRVKSLVLMIASVFVLVFVLGLVSASVTFTGVSGNTTSALEYSTSLQTITVLFQVQDTDTPSDTDGITSISFNTPITLTSGSNSFLSASTVTSAITILADDATSTQMALTITVPASQTLGNYLGTLTLSGTEGINPVTANLGIQVKIQDTTAPVITLTGSNPQYVLIGQTYTDAGATATDNYDLTVTVIPSGTVDQLTEGIYTKTYTATDSSLNIKTATRTVIVTKAFCTLGSSSSNLDLSKFDISNSGRGEDNKWYPLDTLEIEVEFDNNRNSNGQDLYDLADVTFQLGVFDSTGKNVAGDMIWLSKDEEKFEFGDVDEGDDAKHTFKFRVNPAEFDVSGDYKVRLKAYPAGKEATDCIDFSTDMSSFGTSKYSADVSIKMAKDENAVMVDEETLPLPATAQCGQKVTFTADVWNTGDQDWENQILVTLLNTELGISANQTLVGDLDQGIMKQVTFSFNVPEDMEEKQYDLEMKTYYSWDTDSFEYDEVSAETFKFPLSVKGNCVPPQLTVSASLESGGKAGETLVVKATMTNTGTEETSYTFAVSEYSGWASSAKLNNSLTLAAGQSGNILVSFEVDKKAEGDQTFNIEAYSSEGKLLKTQPVQVGIEGRQGFSLSDSDSLVAILIALISAIVIAIIIVLIVKASKK